MVHSSEIQPKDITFSCDTCNPGHHTVLSNQHKRNLLELGSTYQVNICILKQYVINSLFSIIFAQKLVSVVYSLKKSRQSCAYVTFFRTPQQNTCANHYQIRIFTLIYTVLELKQNIFILCFDVTSVCSVLEHSDLLCVVVFRHRCYVCYNFLLTTSAKVSVVDKKNETNQHIKYVNDFHVACIKIYLFI